MSRRIRTIKGEVLLEDERAAELSDAAWRLWVSVRMLADDFGTFRAGDKYLAAQVWQDTSRAKKVPALLSELVAAKKVATFQADGMTLGVILSWRTEQRVDDPSETTRLPFPPQEIRELMPESAQKKRKTGGSAAVPSDFRESSARAGARASWPQEGEGEGEGDPERKGGDLERAGAREPPPAPIDRYRYAFARAVSRGGEIDAPAPSGSAVDQLKSIVESYAARNGISLSEVDRLAEWLEQRAEKFAREADDFVRAKEGMTVAAFARSLSKAPPKKPTVQPAAPTWTMQNVVTPAPKEKTSD